MDLTFGEQILLLLKRKNMTIPEYAQLLEERTGIPCSSQYLNQQLKKDNFLEQDMSILAAALDRRVVISLEPLSSGHDSEDFSMFTGHRTAQREIQIQAEEQSQIEQQNIPAPEGPGEASRTEESQAKPVEQGNDPQAEAVKQTTVEHGPQAEMATQMSRESTPQTGRAGQTPEGSAASTAPLSDQDMMIRQITQGLLAAVQQKSGNGSGKSARPSPSLSPDSINPYTNEEYLNNTVRKHPDQERFIQVYDITEHKWIDVPENYFQKFQAVKRRIMGRDYTPPIYI